MGQLGWIFAFLLVAIILGILLWWVSSTSKVEDSRTQFTSWSPRSSEDHGDSTLENTLRQLRHDLPENMKRMIIEMEQKPDTGTGELYSRCPCSDEFYCDNGMCRQFDGSNCQSHSACRNGSSCIYSTCLHHNEGMTSEYLSDSRISPGKYLLTLKDGNFDFPQCSKKLDKVDFLYQSDKDYICYAINDGKICKFSSIDKYGNLKYISIVTKRTDYVLVPKMITKFGETFFVLDHNGYLHKVLQEDHEVWKLTPLKKIFKLDISKFKIDSVHSDSKTYFYFTLQKTPQTHFYKDECWTKFDKYIECFYPEENLVVFKDNHNVEIVNMSYPQGDVIWKTKYENDYPISQIEYFDGFLWVLSSEHLHKLKINEQIKVRDQRKYLTIDTIYELNDTCLYMYKGVDKLWLLTQL